MCSGMWYRQKITLWLNSSKRNNSMKMQEKINLFFLKVLLNLTMSYLVFSWSKWLIWGNIKINWMSKFQVYMWQKPLYTCSTVIYWSRGCLCSIHKIHRIRILIGASKYNLTYYEGEMEKRTLTRRIYLYSVTFPRLSKQLNDFETQE